MTKRFSGAKILAVSLALAGMVAAPLTASAHGWGGYRGGYGYHGGYHGYYGGGYHRGGGYWSGGRWIAGAILTGVAAGVVADALRPDPYYGPRVVYTQPTVVYEDAPVVTRRVVETRTVYEDPGYTRYVRDDGY